MPGRARPGEGAARCGGARPAPGQRDAPREPSQLGRGWAGRGGPEGARPGSRQRPRTERGRERTMDPKKGGGEEDDCVDSGAETGG